MAITRRQFACGVVASLFSSDPLKAASEVLEKATSPGWFSAPDINAAVLDVGYGKERYTKAYGAAGAPERVFIIASISKVMVATGAMVLKDRGRLALQDRVVRFVPEFRGEGRDQVTIQNLLTHTAGLPDNLPQIRQMQARQAGLDEIFAATCNVPLLFKPGTAFSYPQSASILSDIGLLYAKMGDPSQSVHYTRLARAKSPLDVQLMYSEGQVYALLGQPTKAITAYSQAVAKGYKREEIWDDPENAKTQSSPSLRSWSRAVLQSDVFRSGRIAAAILLSDGHAISA
jgi:tetratricopeptide (TPR) repeat protein